MRGSPDRDNRLALGVNCVQGVDTTVDHDRRRDGPCVGSCEREQVVTSLQEPIEQLALELDILGNHATREAQPAGRHAARAVRITERDDSQR
jgi:hypothetical protein